MSLPTSPNLAAPVSPGPATGPDSSRWFRDHVQPHQSSLRTWLRARFPSLPDVDDLVQESLVRVWRAACDRGPVGNPKSYLFTTARHAAMDLFRRGRIVQLEPLASHDALSVMEDRPSIPDSVNSAQEILLLHAAIADLPPRCREIMTLQKIHGRSNQEIADQLKLSLNTVNAQIVIGLMRCRTYLRAHGVIRGKLLPKEKSA